MRLFKKYSKFHTDKYFPDTFSIQDCLKQDVLSPLLFNFALEYAIKKGQEK
jgi:hypothetical protein